MSLILKRRFWRCVRQNPNPIGESFAPESSCATKGVKRRWSARQYFRCAATGCECADSELKKPYSVHDSRPTLRTFDCRFHFTLACRLMAQNGPSKFCG